MDPQTNNGLPWCRPMNWTKTDRQTELDPLMKKIQGFHTTSQARTLSEATTVTQDKAVVRRKGEIYTVLNGNVSPIPKPDCVSPPGDGVALSEATTVTQDRAVVRRKGESVHVKCVQDGTDQQMYWYRQGNQNSLELIFFSQMEGIDMEKLVVGERFSAMRVNRQLFPLNVTDLRAEDSAVYFCASSLHSTQLQCVADTKT
ncbi:hypothetical protein JZ751_020466 [Albula glossodonta]|uniref:Ig-like domain-containing protein n=1 Tax=Albula glossodonta TaxID=121402 RepID=A0A8T2PFD8_9TELE|nr:hypothetical protein JZ751_020466 [Albula glossodonta]